MVCLGNICRSPLAEGIMRHRMQQSEMPCTVDSAGVLSYHQGEPPQPGSIRSASKIGIDISDQKSRPFVTADFQDFDLIFTMDQSVHQSILEMAAPGSDVSNVHLFLEYAQMGTDVFDPYKCSDEVFDEVTTQIDQACLRIIDRIKSTQSESHGT